MQTKYIEIMVNVPYYCERTNKIWPIHVFTFENMGYVHKYTTTQLCSVNLTFDFFPKESL